MQAQHEDFDDVIVPLKAQFFRLGFTWSHPRVKAWMERAGFKNQYQMPKAAYQALTRKLEEVSS